MEGPADPAPLTELQRRLVFSLLRPAVQLARTFRMPLGALVELCRLAYFEELRRRGNASQAEIARLFGKSLRTVGSLERQYRDDFFAPEHEVELERRIEDALGEAPRSAAEVAQALGEVGEVGEPEVARVLEALVVAGRAQAEDAGGERAYAARRDFVSLVREDLRARLDGLHHQLDVVGEAARQRFLGNGGGARGALGRTFSFVASDAQAEALGAKLARLLRAECNEVEDAALEQGGWRRYAITVALASMDEGSER